MEIERKKRKNKEILKSMRLAYNGGLQKAQGQHGLDSKASHSR
jgi:hypothetical protein